MSVEQLRLEVTDGGSTDRVISRLGALGAAADKAFKGFQGISIAGGLGKVKQAAEEASVGVGLLGKALGALTAYFSVREVISFADSYLQLTSEINKSTESAKESTAVWEKLQGVAAATRTDLDTTVYAYQRIHLASEELGLSQQKVIDIVQILNKFMIVQGYAAGEAEAGIRGVARAMALGKLDAQGLRPIISQFPELLTLLAKSANMSKEAFKQFVARGQFDSKMLVDALTDMSGEIDEKFNKTRGTVGQSFTQIKNSFIELTGAVEETTHIFSGLASFITAIANAIRSLTGDTAALRKENEAYHESLKKGMGTVPVPSGASLVGYTFGSADSNNSPANKAHQAYLSSLGSTGDEGKNLAKSIGREAAGASDVDLNRIPKVEAHSGQSDILDNLAREFDMQKRWGDTIGTQRDLQIEADKTVYELKKSERNSLSDQEKEDAADAVFGILSEIAAIKALNAVKNDTNGVKNQLDAEQRLIGIYGTERTVLEDLITTEQALKDSGADLSNEQVKAALAEREASQRALAARKEEFAILDQVVGRDQKRIQDQTIINELYLTGKLNLTQYAEALENAGVQSDTFASGLGEVSLAFKNIDHSVQGLGRTIGESLTGAVQSASGALADFAVDGARNARSLQQAFSDLFKSLAKQIIAAVIQMLVLKAVEATLGGVLGGSTASANHTEDLQVDSSSTMYSSGEGDIGFAAGGDVSGGRTILVGEKGPELFRTPIGGGRVIPNDQLGSGQTAPPVNVNVINQLSEHDIAQGIDTPAGHAVVLKIFSKNRRNLGRLS